MSGIESEEPVQLVVLVVVYNMLLVQGQILHHFTFDFGLKITSFVATI